MELVVSSSAAFDRPVGRIGMLQIPKRAAAAHHGNGLKVLGEGRRGGGPLERPGIPGIVSGTGAGCQAGENVADEDERAEAQDYGTERRNQIERGPARQVRIGVYPA